MSFFGCFKRKKRHGRRKVDDLPAGKTTPGLKAIKDLWDIGAKKPPERIEGEVETNIYAINRSNGIPRRTHPHHHHRTSADDSPGPAY